MKKSLNRLPLYLTVSVFTAFLILMNAAVFPQRASANFQTDAEQAKKSTAVTPKKSPSVKASPTTSKSTPKSSPRTEGGDDSPSSNSPRTQPQNENDRSASSSTSESNGERPTNSESTTGEDDSEGEPAGGLWNILYWSLLSLIGLSLTGGIGFLIYRSSQKSKLEREATQKGFGAIKSKYNGLRQEVDQLKATAELLSKQLSEQRKEIGALKAKTQSEANSTEKPPPPPQSNYPSAAPAPKFPVTVENYLEKNAVGALFGKYDPLFGTLKENSADGAFYLIRDGAISDDARYAVPRVKQFVTRDDFAYHYSNYYECADPTGGEVWIKKTAIVRRTPDGWRLDRMGELEVR